MEKTHRFMAVGRVLTLALVLAALVIGPCLASDYVGTWKGSMGDMAVTMVLKGDGTGKFIASGHDPIAFTWHEGDEGIVLDNPDGGKPNTATLLEDGRLHMLDGDSGKTTDFTKQ